MILLPPNLAAVADVTHTDCDKFAINCVSVTETPEGYTVAATNGRVAVVVEGTNAEPPADYPTWPELATVPNTATSALIPAADFRRALRAVPKPRQRRKAILSNLAVVCGPDGATLATTDGATTSVARSPRPTNGRFPSIPDVIPTGPPDVTVNFDVILLINLLKAAAAVSPAVTLEFRDGKPLVVRAKNYNQSLTGVVTKSPE